MISFNRPYYSGNELNYIKQAIDSGHISGNGSFTKKCHTFFENKYNFKKCLLTTSCTDALEMASILLDIKEGDEVIIPSFTFVSTANAFALRGAKIVFADCRSDFPCIDENSIEALITNKTKAIVPVHYAGIACNMDIIMRLAEKYNLFVVEDAAQAIDSYYKGRPLGSIGTLGAFSFHETKNICSGEGGMLTINDARLIKRAEIIWEKGTNRVEYFKGEANKYGWVDVGSSFLASDITAAYLFAQLENLELIQKRRMVIWNSYFEMLLPLANIEKIKLPIFPPYSTNNFHLFYILTQTGQIRDKLINFLKENEVNAVFHYLPLHKSLYFSPKYIGKVLDNSDYFSDHLLRLPFYFDLENESISYIVKLIESFFRTKS
jgi:dTDP-4-amino-4,6-dideoxygalactose transaminase